MVFSRQTQVRDGPALNFASALHDLMRIYFWIATDSYNNPNYNTYRTFLKNRKKNICMTYNIHRPFIYYGPKILFRVVYKSNTIENQHLRS
jgi:hypothetical protein